METLGTECAQRADVISQLGSQPSPLAQAGVHLFTPSVTVD